MADLDDQFMIALHKLGVIVVISVTTLASALALIIYVQEQMGTKSIEPSPQNQVGAEKLY